MKTKLQHVCICLIVVFLITSCKKDDFKDQIAAVDVTLNYPDIDGDFDVKKLSLTFEDINSGEKNTVDINTESAEEKTSAQLAYGTYTANVEGEIEVEEEGISKTYTLRGYLTNIIVNSAEADAAIDLFLSDPSAKFVFKEIFFTGTETPENKTYNGDKYFIIYNNSMDTLYADGLIIAQSSFLTVTKRDYTPNVMDEAFTTSQIVMIPGSGTDHPVYPGKEIVIANNAIDHREYNTNSFDLTGADYEIELVGSINVDNPAVPNTTSLAGNLLMHNRGFTSYALAKLPEDVEPEEFIEESAYTYSYTAQNGREMSFDAHKIPNDYIMDAVNLSVSETFEWIVTAPSLDMGWTHCGTTSSDNTRFGKAVTRKVLSKSEEGIELLQDTNNSTDDFEAETAPSLK